MHPSVARTWSEINVHSSSAPPVESHPPPLDPCRYLHHPKPLHPKLASFHRPPFPPRPSRRPPRRIPACRRLSVPLPLPSALRSPHWPATGSFTRFHAAHSRPCTNKNDGEWFRKLKSRSAEWSRKITLTSRCFSQVFPCAVAQALMPTPGVWPFPGGCSAWVGHASACQASVARPASALMPTPACETLSQPRTRIEMSLGTSAAPPRNAGV